MKFEGKTIIELRDAKTGKLTKRTEDKNMLTNALTEFYKQGGMTNPSAFNVSDLRADALHYLLGGVLLLDTELDEDATIIRVPSGVGMTGNGAYNVLNSGNPPELGSWNDNESGWQQDGSYKMVWDYTTSQANGTVACVCLTSSYGGRRGVGNKSGTSNTNGQTMSGYNSTISPASINLPVLGVYNNVRTCLTAYDGGSGAKYWDGRTTWTINKYAYPTSQVDLRDTINNRLIEQKTVTLPAGLQNLGYVDSGEVQIRQIGQYAYIMMCPATTSGSYYTRYFHFSDAYPITIAKYNLANDTVEVYKVLSPSTTGLAAFDMAAGVYPNAALSADYAVYSKYVFDLNTLANVSELTDIGEYGTSIWAIDDDIAEANAVRVDMAEGTWSPVNASSGGHYGTLVYNGLLGNDGGVVFRDPRYIATINNLEAPVTKTADKTMKVTYVVRFS